MPPFITIHFPLLTKICLSHILKKNLQLILIIFDIFIYFYNKSNIGKTIFKYEFFLFLKQNIVENALVFSFILFLFYFILFFLCHIPKKRNL